jgi:S-adenosylmethionine hydrolase
MKVSGIISLTTDFGVTDPYVGQMKGAILQRNTSVQLVDLSHEISRQDIIGAAIMLHSSYAFFPAATVHLVVVDPGVGSERRILAAEGEGYYFIAPDNGIFSLFLRDGLFNRVYLVEEKALFAKKVSATFHGRDIMGPVAAALAGGGLALKEVGTEVLPASCICLDLPVARISETSIHGEVVQVDHFGNIRTSIRRADMQHVKDPHQCQVQIKGYEIGTLSSTYAEAMPGELLALFDSAGYLEIAVNRGSAAELTQCRIGDPVQVNCS